jgi:NarL family two-component system response regulator LiaR
VAGAPGVERGLSELMTPPATVPLRVAVVDAHDVFRDGLCSLLGHEDGIEIVAETGSAEQGLDLIGRARPDVAIVDLVPRGISGIEVIRLLSSSVPSTNVLVLTLSDDEDDVFDAILAGACGYLLKDSSIDEIVAGVRATAAGESLISPRVAAKLLARLRRISPPPAAAQRRSELTERELGVLRLLAEGRGNGEIADALYISPQTAKNHVSSILFKLGVENRIQAAVFAVRAGLV